MTDEDGFLGHIRTYPDDAVARLAYADWLEEHDDLLLQSKASYLRYDASVAELPTDSPARDTAVLEMRKLAEVLPLEWKSAVSRLPLENCEVDWQFACPKKWEELAPTDRSFVRHCSACQNEVRYCSSISEARTVAALGGCVVVDLHVRRKPGDLEGEEPLRYMTAGIMAPPPDEPNAGGFRAWIRRRLRGDR